MDMKEQIGQLIASALQTLINKGELPLETLPNIHIERTRDAKHGDYACNVALTLAKQAKKPPRAIAEAIIEALPQSNLITQTEIAGPGFINFFLDAQSSFNIIQQILKQKENFGRVANNSGQKILIEFVSANPTGPLHVGHGRGAAYGSCIANLLDNAGHSVHKEYYVNDAGRQMDILAVSVWLRYLQKKGLTFDFPPNIYQGSYIIDIAESMKSENCLVYICKNESLDEMLGLYQSQDDNEIALDHLITEAKTFCGEFYPILISLALNPIKKEIKADLENFRVFYNSWYSERSLHDSGKIEQSIDELKKAGHLYQQDGAWWFKSSEFGDEKDRVAVRDNGSMTYFAADIAYHKEKFERGFDKVINIFGADHHGYIPRLRAILSALNIEQERLDVLLVQFANLWRDGEKVQMSTRSGQFVTLQELIDEVGVDATRFFYIMRKSDQHLDFDLTLAKSRTSENPVYYIQYAHARICSVLRQLDEKGFTWNDEDAIKNLEVLTEKHEQILIDRLSRYPETVDQAAQKMAPHLLANYLRECANDFHAYYNSSHFIVDDTDTRNARIALVKATQQVILNGLNILAIHAPESM